MQKCYSQQEINSAKGLRGITVWSWGISVSVPTADSLHKIKLYWAKHSKTGLSASVNQCSRKVSGEKPTLASSIT